MDMAIITEPPSNIKMVLWVYDVQNILLPAGTLGNSPVKSKDARFSKAVTTAPPPLLPLPY